MENTVKLFLFAFLATTTIAPANYAQSSSEAKSETANTSKTETGKQAPASQPLSARVPTPKPEDVKSLDSILVAIYDVISGPAGDRDWNRFRSLFVPEARLTSATKHKDGSIFLTDVEGYARGAGGYFKTHGFYENAIANRVQKFGNIAQVFSSYESRNAPNEKPFARGVNSIQLFNDGTRWWVLSILWDEETPANPLPPDLAAPVK
jgi:hypothetical protein